MALTWHAATRALAVANQAVKAFPQNPNVEVQTLEKQVERLRSQADTSRDQERTALGRLQQMADAGVYSQVSELANEIESLEADIRRHELHLGAIKLLHDLLEQRHREIAIAVTKPVADKASRLMQRIAGPRLGSVHLNDTFQPAGLVTGAASTPVFMEDLSGGESEQIHLAVRLALADQMAAGERELLVLDDVLTATDSGRLARIQTILGEFAHRFQIVILTCHPERYGGLEGANMIDLEAIVGR